MIWQKRLRLLLGAVVIALVSGVTWYATRDRAQGEGLIPSPRTDEAALTELVNEEFTRVDTETGEVVFTLKAEHTLIYADGRVIQRNMSARFMRRNAAPLDVSAAEAVIVQKPGAGGDPTKFDTMHLRGNVVVDGGDGDVHLATDEALYNDLTGILTTDKATTVRRGNMSGSGTGATFDRDRGVTWLLADAKVTIQTGAQGTLDVTSTRAGLAQLDQYMRFEENVRMTRGGRLIETDAAIAHLMPDGAGITSLELRGNSRITGGAAGDGGVPNMAGDDITITYGAETGLLERAVLNRAARLDLPEGGGRSLAADSIDIGFAPDGTTVTLLDASDSVELKIPAAGDDPSTEVRAPRLESRGAAPKGLERATFSGGVEFRERAPARGDRAAIDRIGRSESLVLALDGGFDEIKDADFSGNVRFRDADVTAEAPNARYGVDSDLIALQGGSGVSRVVQDSGTVQAKTIDLTLDPRKLVAKGSVRSTLKPGARKERKEPRPSILDDDQPVNVTSAALDYDGGTERAVYTGDARLWQGDTVIQGDTIVLDDKTGNLEARGNVRGQFMIRDEHAEPGAAAPKPTLVRSDTLLYVESGRQATFRGKTAKVTGPDGDIAGERIELFLEEDGKTLRRAEAYETVTARLDGGRVATGSRLIYDAKTRRYDMRGTPLRVRRQFSDKTRDGAPTTRCEETVGATLTFDRSADTVTVVGANGAPSRTVPVPCGPGGTHP